MGGLIALLLLSMSYMNTSGRGAGGQATTVAAPIQVVALLFDKNRLPVHNSATEGSFFFAAMAKAVAGQL